MLPTESRCDIGEDSECKPNGVAERKGEPRAGGWRAVCVRTGEASKVPDSLKLSNWSLVKPKGVHRRRRVTRDCVRTVV